MAKGKVLVTGGAGFIGSHIVDALLEAGYEVVVLDNLLPQVHKHTPVDDEGWPLYLTTECERVKGSILDIDLVRALMADATHLVHLAGSVGVGQSMTDTLDYVRNNTLGAATVLQVLYERNHQIQRIAQAGSISAYGEGAMLRQSTGEIIFPGLRPAEQLKRRDWGVYLDGEELIAIPTPESKPLDPQSIYAENMQSREKLFLIKGRSLGIPTASMRMFNVYGVRQSLSNPYTGVLAIFASRLLNGNAPTIYEDGGQLRNFIHVRDVAQAYVAFLESDDEMYETFNIGSPDVVTIQSLACTAADLMGLDIQPEVTGLYRAGDIRNCFPDIEKSSKVLGWKAQISLEQGLPEVIEWTATQEAIDYNGANIERMRREGILS